jgi:hypothetical protein
VAKARMRSAIYCVQQVEIVRQKSGPLGLIALIGGAKVYLTLNGGCILIHIAERLIVAERDDFMTGHCTTQSKFVDFLRLSNRVSTLPADLKARPCIDANGWQS